MEVSSWEIKWCFFLNNCFKLLPVPVNSGCLWCKHEFETRKTENESRHMHVFKWSAVCLCPSWHMSPCRFTFLWNTALIAPPWIAVSLPHMTIESNHEHWRKCEWNRGRESRETTSWSYWWKFPRRTSFQSRWRQKPNRTQMIFIDQASISFHTRDRHARTYIKHPTTLLFSPNLPNPSWCSHSPTPTTRLNVSHKRRQVITPHRHHLSSSPWQLFLIWWHESNQPGQEGLSPGS